MDLENWQDLAKEFWKESESLGGFPGMGSGTSGISFQRNIKTTIRRLGSNSLETITISFRLGPIGEDMYTEGL